MNRVDRSQRFIDEGRSLVSDPVGRTAPPKPPSVDVDDDAFVPKGLRAWAGRISNGFYVQGLVAEDGTTFISAGVAGQHQTFEVPRDKASEAFEHPYAYGCTILL